MERAERTIQGPVCLSSPALAQRTPEEQARHRRAPGPPRQLSANRKYGHLPRCARPRSYRRWWCRACCPPRACAAVAAERAVAAVIGAGAGKQRLEHDAVAATRDGGRVHPDAIGPAAAMVVVPAAAGAGEVVARSIRQRRQFLARVRAAPHRRRRQPSLPALTPVRHVAAWSCSFDSARANRPRSCGARRADPIPYTACVGRGRGFSYCRARTLARARGTVSASRRIRPSP